MTCHHHTLQLLPFYSITNVELLKNLETIESHIKSCLENQNITKLVQASLPESLLTKHPCKYYTYEQLFQLNKKHDCKELNLLHLNVRSLDKHLSEVITLMKTTGDNYNFIALSEIGRSNISSRKAELEKKYGLTMKYEIPQSSKGGVGLIHDCNLNLIERNDINIKSKVINGNRTIIENIWYETDFPDSKDNYIIGVIYRHPGGTADSLNYFTQQLESTLIKINQEKKKCIITGDINIDGLKLNSNENVKSFFNMTLEQTFIPTITIPTRIVDYSVSLIDHIFINSPIIKEECDILTGNVYCDISDHLPSFIKIKTKSNFDKNSRPMVRIFGEKNIEHFQYLIDNQLWEKFYSSQDPNQALCMFYEIYDKAFEQAFPLVNLSRNRAKDKVWITKGLRKSIYYKNKLHSKCIFKPTYQNKLEYTTYKNILTSCLRKTENDYYKNLINSEKQNLHTLWNIFGSIINPQKVKSSNRIKALHYNNKKITDDQEISNTLNEHFSTIGSKLANNIKSRHSYKDYLQNPNQSNFFLHPTDTNEILKIIQNFKPKRSCGKDNISPKLLQKNALILTEPITHIINLSFQNGIVPDQLKIAKVVPIYKRNERFLPDNYRPISLLSTLCKIMEKVMCKRLITFLNKYHILYDFQFGFRETYSTSQALIEIVDSIQKDLEDGKFVAGLYMDLSKAFDTVNHTILLNKMHHYGIRGQALDWFTDYLNNRQQYTLVNNKISNLCQITYGVPQGSVLGPLLFLIYINDIAKSTKIDCLNRLFADDANIFVSRESPKELKQSITQIFKDLFKWFDANKLTLNLSKTCYTIFKTKTKKIPEYMNNTKVRDTTIKREKSAKYLGVMLDENLNWHAHIAELNQSIIKIGNSFKIIKRQIPECNKILIYNAYVHSKVQYGIEVYGRAATSQIKKVQTQQNRAIKILFSKDYYTPTKTLHKDLNILLVEDLYKLNILKFVHRHQNNLLPNIFSDFFVEITNVHNHFTRQSKGNGLHVNQPKNIHGKSLIKHQGPTLWNSIPESTRSLQSSKTFSNKVKQILMVKYI